MSWFSNLSDTYERLADIVGIPDEKGNILLPPNHMAGNTDICITIDGDGNFLYVDNAKQNIIIPCTEDSSTRAGKVEYPHPLHEQIGYLSLDKKKRAAYCSQLEKWCVYHPKVEAVYKYISRDTLINDLHLSDIQNDDPKLFVRFSVEESPDDLTPHLWEDFSVALAWQKFCETTQMEEQVLCYVTGDMAPVRIKHPKGINPSTNGAKLVSCNDDANYTYKGRFTKSGQANAISSKSSHQAHSMLKYLIAAQGYKCDTQAIVAWAIDNDYTAISPFKNTVGLVDSLGIHDDEPDRNTETDRITLAQGIVDRDYAKILRNALTIRGNAARLKGRSRHIAIIAVDAATTGRMAVTYYQDMNENDYVERVATWHDSCRWHYRGKVGSYISAPSVDRIIAAVFGEPKGEGYNKVKKQARERLLHCILNGKQIDRGWMTAAVHRVSNPFSYDKQDGGWDKYKWESSLRVTCAITRKYYSDKKEELSLELEAKREDRDYLYGRLLAIADKIESHARYLQTGKNDTDKRATNAVRYMSAFSAKPLRTWKLIVDQLNPYIQRLDGAEWYQKQIDEIMSLFPDGGFESDRPLDGKYLLGYSLQRRALYSKNDEEETDYVEQED